MIRYYKSNTIKDIVYCDLNSVLHNNNMHLYLEL